MLHRGPSHGAPSAPPYRNPTAAEPGSSQDKILTQLLEEQRKTNQLLLMLIEAMGDDGEPDDLPVTYMDGSRVS